ncbi:MAG TPA: hypothetical protein VG917_01450 [Patescibacteria group bacterium]|nr:hypothetical protein [Patescibacteria group bacterium]
MSEINQPDGSHFVNPKNEEISKKETVRLVIEGSVGAFKKLTELLMEARGKGEPFMVAGHEVLSIGTFFEADEYGVHMTQDLDGLDSPNADAKS